MTPKRRRPLPRAGRGRLAARGALAALVFCAALPAGATQASATDDVQPPALVWGAVPNGDLYLLVASPRLGKSELQQLAAKTIGPGIGDNQYLTQVWSNRPEPIQLWLSIDPARLREAGLSRDQALEAAGAKLGVSAQPNSGIGVPSSWRYPGATREKFQAWTDTPPRLANGSVVDLSALATLTYRQAPDSWEAWNKVTLSLSIAAETNRDSLEGVVSGRLKALASKLPEDVSILILPAGHGLGEADGIFVTFGPDE
ncbi:efflux RND transporter permease subunit [Achromobacter sp. UMC46]|uniref:efflux RND transporter permease subunit n=1 Tax=Achromobacter sp. UMC46 TaxID=1862319 RepID=UPI001602777F|nr:efflux RND transporter permease subunit [Achromobacter sp. UMC46]